MPSHSNSSSSAMFSRPKCIYILGLCNRIMFFYLFIFFVPKLVMVLDILFFESVSLTHPIYSFNCEINHWLSYIVCLSKLTESDYFFFLHFSRTLIMTMSRQHLEVVLLTAVLLKLSDKYEPLLFDQRLASWFFPFNLISKFFSIDYWSVFVYIFNRKFQAEQIQSLKWSTKQMYSWTQHKGSHRTIK